jgi:RNA polymerase subunit RPABC4/transcription elongation factor Spt4
MRYCHNCHKVTTGEPLFCHSCGFTYDAKLCHARHINPRWATVCSQCGSRDLTTPAPRVSLAFRLLLLLASLLPGVVLVLLLVLAVAAVFSEVMSNQAIQGQLVATIFVLALLWWLWLQLPHFIQKMFRSLWPKSKKEKDRHSH